MSKQSMRRAWFQVHKWIGLILAVLIIPISITGAALVWHDALDKVLNPARYAISGDAMLPPQRYVDAARGALKPGERIATLTLPDDEGPVVIAASSGGKPARPGPPQRTMVYLDPPTARVLDVASSGAGIVRAMHMIHGSLMLPGIGRSIVGWIGVAMLLSSFTGLWLWWPSVGKVARGLRWRRHRNFDTNLHHLFGFWIALPLFVLSLTGAWISFPAFFAGLTGAAPQRGPDRAAMARAKPLEKPVQSLEGVIAKAGVIGRGDIKSIGWPTDRKPDWTIAYAAGEGRPVSVGVGDADGVVAKAPLRDPGNPTARLMRQLHDGTGMGVVWQTIIFLGGLLPAVLAVTGIIMWWRARGWKGELKRKRAAREAVAAE